jgi:hypothetical protein
MLGPFVRPRLLCLRYASSIITIEIHRTERTRNNTQLRNEFFDPNSLLCSFRRSNVLSFHRRICDSILVGTFLTHRPTIEVEHKTGLQFRIIHICLEASTVTLYNKLFFTSKNKEHFLGSSQVLYDVLYNCSMSFTII